MKTSTSLSLKALLFGLLCFTVGSKLGAPALTGFVALSALAAISYRSGVFGLTINPAQLTFNGQEVQEMSEAIFKDTFVKPAINDFHTLYTGIKAKKQIAYLGTLGLVGKAGAGCDPTADTNTITMSEKFWDPASISIRLEECWADLEEVFMVWGKKNGIEAADLTGTEYLMFIEERLKDAIEEAKLRLTWFGDTAAANYNDSPAGIIVNSVDPAYFNAITGLWKQIYTLVASDSTKKAATITKNAGASFAAQAFDTTDTTNKVVHGYFQSIIENADTRLSDREDKFFLVTKSVYDQYKRELRSYTATESAFEMVLNGKKVLSFDGVPVVQFSFWDRMIRTYLQNGTVYYQPHRIILTVKEVLGVGCEDEKSFGSIDPFYDKKSRKTIVDAIWKQDAKLIKDELIEVAY